MTALAMTASGVAACTASNSPHTTPAIQVEPQNPLFDQDIHITVTGLAKGEKATIGASMVDSAKLTWATEADFSADDNGVIDLATAQPETADHGYDHVDGMGLLWAVHLPRTVDDNEYFPFVAPQTQPVLPVTLTVTEKGHVVATRTVDRHWLAPGETAKVLTLDADKVAGVLFTPPPGTPKHAGVLVFGGAEGGMAQVFTAALLAAHGYPAVSVAYFAYPGLPAHLQDIPLEYFATAGRILAAAPGVATEHILAMGYSRGSEAAQLLAQDFPDLFHGAIVYSPSDQVNPAQDDPTANAWTLGGQPVPQVPIVLDHVSGPVLAIAGKADKLWDSQGAADRMVFHLGENKDPFPHQELLYDDAGHGVGTFPYQPIGSGAVYTLGGSRAGDVASQRDSWAKVLDLLGGLTG